MYDFFFLRTSQRLVYISINNLLEENLGEHRFLTNLLIHINYDRA